MPFERQEKSNKSVATQTLSGSGELCTPTVELHLQKPMHVVLSPTGDVFISNIYELDYPHINPQIIHRLSAHYPYIIHMLSVLYEAAARARSTLPACAHRSQTRPKRLTARLAWPGRRLGHTHGQGLARWQWPGTLYAIRSEWRRVEGSARHKCARLRARAVSRLRHMRAGLVQAGQREGCERCFR